MNRIKASYRRAEIFDDFDNIHDAFNLVSDDNSLLSYMYLPLLRSEKLELLVYNSRHLLFRTLEILDIDRIFIFWHIFVGRWSAASSWKDTAGCQRKGSADNKSNGDYCPLRGVPEKKYSDVVHAGP